MSYAVKVTVTPCEIGILIQGLPHLLLRRGDLVGIQAYIREAGSRVPIYFIEFTTQHGEIVCDYDNRKLWEMILAALRDARLFEHMQGQSVLSGSA